MKHKVVFCWRGISGYMSACWRALAARADKDDIDLHVISYRPETRKQRAAPFDFEHLSAGFSVELIDYHDLHEAGALARHVIAHQPSVVVLPGWTNRAAVALTEHRDLQHTRFVLAMDTPWRGDWRQRLARYRLRRLLRRAAHAVVPGERGWQYARRLGFAERQISRGLYGIDYDSLHPTFNQRAQRAEGWPARFLFVGRYVPNKGMGVLLDAYARYRSQHDSPFGLSCCGTGAYAEQVRAAEGVTDHGFVQPDALPGLFAEHGVFVLPSRYEPWGVALVEACAAGLPVICTSACGSAVEVVRDEANGWIVPTDDVELLAAAMGRAHEQFASLPTMGRSSQPLAAPYSSELWAVRWGRMLRELTGKLEPAHTAEPM